MNEFQNLKQSNNLKQTRKRNKMSETLRPLRDGVILTNLERGQRMSAGGIVIPDDDGKDTGIRARWGQVYAVGPEQKDVKVGEWVLMQHGRWTTGADVKLKGKDAFRFWKADPKGMLGISEIGKPPNIAVETIVDS
jgi:co-chaperonin GroES (HSP10)